MFVDCLLFYFYPGYLSQRDGVALEKKTRSDQTPSAHKQGGVSPPSGRRRGARNGGGEADASQEASERAGAAGAGRAVGADKGAPPAAAREHPEGAPERPAQIPPTGRREPNPPRSIFRFAALFDDDMASRIRMGDRRAPATVHYGNSHNARGWVPQPLRS